MARMTIDPHMQAIDRFLDEDTQLMQRARTDPHAFAPLYEKYFPRIYAYCLRRLGQAEDAEDMTSLVFTQAFSSLTAYRGGSVAAWLFRIAHNAVASHWRSHRSARSLDSHAILASLPDERSLEPFTRAETRLEVARLIATLPEKHQELLALTVAGGLSAKEVGQILGKSEGAVWTALHRIVQTLKNAHRQQEEEEHP